MYEIRRVIKTRYFPWTYNYGTNWELIIPSVCPSVCLSIKSIYLRNTGDRYSDLYFIHLLKKKTWRYITKNACSVTIKGIKINRVLPVDIQLWNLAASIYTLHTSSRKNLKTIHLWLNQFLKKILKKCLNMGRKFYIKVATSSEVSDGRALAKQSLNFQ